jgi:uncharacterized protein (UPF0332 family)
MFGLHFVSTGIVAKEIGKFYTELFELRQDSDYESYFEFEVQEVIVLLPPAKNLITEVGRILGVGNS